MKQLIYDVRFGIRSLSELSNTELLELMDYFIPHDVMEMCFTEIRDRRQKNLKKEKTTTATQETKYELGALFHEADGAIYKYGKIDFGSLGIDTETNQEVFYVDYMWFPWNMKARAKGIRTTMEPAK